MATIMYHCIAAAVVVAAMVTADYKMLGVAPQGTQLLIECESGNISSILSATYGSPNCQPKDVKEMMQRLCVSHHSCNVRVDDDLLGGDVCLGQQKNLSVEALCWEKPRSRADAKPALLSFSMMQRLVSLRGIVCPEHELREAFDACDKDTDGHINESEIDDLIGRLQKQQQGAQPDGRQSTEAPPMPSPAPSNTTQPPADRITALLASISSLNDDVKSLLKPNSTAAASAADRQQAAEFTNMMAVVPASAPPAPSPSPTPGPLFAKKHRHPVNTSTVQNTIDVLMTNAGNETDPFSTRSVVYVPTGQTRKLLCSGAITDVWFSTYWWPNSAATEHVRTDPECHQEEDVALIALRQLCLQKPDCTVTTPAATLSAKCPLALKYVTIAYKCTINPVKPS